MKPIKKHRMKQKESNSNKRKISAFFLDRDGVINQNAKEHDYIKTWKEFKFYSNTLDALKMIQKSKIPTFIITNQRGISRQLMNEDDLTDIHTKMLAEIINYGGNIKEIYVCPHGHEDECKCRKPNPGMILQAAKEHSINLDEAVLIGDTKSDILAGQAAGCKTVLVRTGHGDKQDVASWEIKPSYICKDLSSAVNLLI